MRPLALLALVLGLSTGVLAQSGSVTFRWRAPAAGDARFAASLNRSKSVTEMTVDGETRGGTVESLGAARRSYEILAAGAGGVTKFRVRYHEMRSETKSDVEAAPPGRGRGGRGGAPAEEAEPTPDPTELVGRSFVVDLGGETPVVTDAELGAVDAGLSRLVLALEVAEGAFRGWGPDARELVGERTLRIGESLEVEGDAAMALVGRPGGARGGRGGGRRGGAGNGGGRGGMKAVARLTLREETTVLGRPCARFDLEVTVSSAGGGGGGGEGGGGGRRGGGRREIAPRVYRGELLVGCDSLWIHRLRTRHESDSDQSRTMQDREIHIRRSARETRDQMAIFSTAKPKAAPAS
ncbi:MAG: hypothetical protein R3F20_05095 [Planctomycetota bacterium]